MWATSISSSSRTIGINIGSGRRLKDSNVPEIHCPTNVRTKKKPTIEEVVCALTVKFRKIKKTFFIETEVEVFFNTKIFFYKKSLISFLYILIITSLLYNTIYVKLYNYSKFFFFKKIIFLTFLIILSYYLIQVVTDFEVTGLSLFFIDSLFNLTPISLEFRWTFLSSHFVFLTVFLTIVILSYSSIYMKDDPTASKFSILIAFFSCSMVGLLSAKNLWTLILGWEFIGLSSFLLINYWSSRSGTLKAALKAFSYNKVSDVGIFLFGLGLLNNVSFSTPLSTLNHLLYLENSILWILGGVLLATFCKSVQFGFHTWLPDSMEAPIPASALIHSATLVSAGIYLTLLFNVALQPLTPILTTLGAITAVYGAVISSTQTDLKKILAFSTISHCGYLFFLSLSGNPILLILYFHFHGFFKALSFLLVGFMLQRNSIYQDYRILKKENYLGFEYFSLPPIVLNLAGLPFVLGFFSKFLLLGVYQNLWWGGLTLLLLQLGAVCGIFYSYSVVVGLFLIKPNLWTPKTNYLNKLVPIEFLILGSQIIIFTIFIFTYLISNFGSLAILTEYYLVSTPFYMILFYKVLCCVIVLRWKFTSITLFSLIILTLTYLFF